MKGICWEAGQKILYLKRSDIKKLLNKPPEALEDSQKHKDIEQYLKGQPEIKKYWSLYLNLKHSWQETMKIDWISG